MLHFNFTQNCQLSMQSNSNTRKQDVLGADRCLEVALWELAEGYVTAGLSPGVLACCCLPSSHSACGCPACSCTAWGSEGVLLHHCQSKTNHLNPKTETNNGLCYYQVPASLLQKSGAGSGNKHEPSRCPGPQTSLARHKTRKPASFYLSHPSPPALRQGPVLFFGPCIINRC